MMIQCQGFSSGHSSRDNPAFTWQGAARPHLGCQLSLKAEAGELCLLPGKDVRK